MVFNSSDNFFSSVPEEKRGSMIEPLTVLGKFEFLLEGVGYLTMKNARGNCFAVKGDIFTIEEQGLSEIDSDRRWQMCQEVEIGKLTPNLVELGGVKGS